MFKGIQKSVFTGLQAIGNVGEKKKKKTFHWHQVTFSAKLVQRASCFF